MPVKPKIILSLAQHRKMDVVKTEFTDYDALKSKNIDILQQYLNQPEIKRYSHSTIKTYMHYFKDFVNAFSSTKLLEHGFDLRYIQTFLCHVSNTTTEIYTHVSKRSLTNIKSPLDQITEHKQLNH